MKTAEEWTEEWALRFTRLVNARSVPTPESMRAITGEVIREVQADALAGVRELAEWVEKFATGPDGTRRLVDAADVAQYIRRDILGEV